MARVVQNTRMEKREQRLKLDPRKKPYWMTLNEGEHLGYYRGARVGKWLVRYRKAGTVGNYLEATLAEADDFADADGVVILDFRQAQSAARRWVADLERNEGRRIGVFTVGAALNDYIAGFEGKDLANTLRRIEAIIRPQIGAKVVAKLTALDVRKWRDSLAEAPARLRTRHGEQQNFRNAAQTDDERRKRKASANRILTIFKAAMNVAYRDGKVGSDDAWRRVKPFPKVDAPRLRYLIDDEARRLVNASPADLRLMVQGALLTGARYSELCRLNAKHFDRQAQTLWLEDTKAGKGRVVYLEAEGVRLFTLLTAGKGGSDPVFVKDDGLRWKPANQSRPMRAACEAARIDAAGFHDLRRTYGARMALQGVPMAVIAEAMGHADERITRRHYAHLSPNYVAQSVRNAVSGMGIVDEPTNVVAFQQAANC